jgi:hypothetical protein
MIVTSLHGKDALNNEAFFKSLIVRRLLCSAPKFRSASDRPLDCHIGSDNSGAMGSAMEQNGFCWTKMQPQIDDPAAHSTYD